MAQKKIAVYPGSFDPITNGHIDLINRSLRIFDRVIVAIATNPNKDDSLFSLEDRLTMVRETVKGLGSRVQVESFHGLLVNYAQKIGAQVIIRGLRAVSDFEYEFQMTMMNRELNTKLETLFMMPGESYFYLSSRLVKEVVGLGGDVSAFVPKNVFKRLKAKFNE